MDKLFGPDSLFFKYGTILCDLIILTIIWSVVSLPIFTVGAATTALYYVTTRQLSDREGYVTRDFFKSFKQNFVTATLLTIFFAFFAVILFFNITSAYKTIFFYLSIVIAYEVIATAMYAFPILSRFELKFFGVLRNAFFMANRHIVTTISCFAVFIVMVFICIKFPFLFVVCVGLYCFITSIFFMMVFRKYVPDMDRDKEDNI
ncbi:MAG: YesL family protein [Lachnospirales bacterium]